MTVPIISALPLSEGEVEIVERKGRGHPDTICDALAETFSRNLCREYRRRYGRVLHHNVDKALLCGGRAAPRFGGGKVLAPIDIYLAGRAIVEIGNDRIPTSEIAIDGSREWLKKNLHALNVEEYVNVRALVQPGSQDLQELFSRSGQGIPLSNDTSIGVGYAPTSPLEHLVLEAEKLINRQNDEQHPAWGEDVKVMGIRCGDKVQLMVACAIIDRYVAHIDDYLAQKALIEEAVKIFASTHKLSGCVLEVNAGDSPKDGKIYLTVTGTSAEAGDDGQVGRGNRVNGLITPCRPMSLEAAAGKNPVSHVGKIYNVLANRISAALVAMVPEITAAQCLMVSRIGEPVDKPALLQVKLTTADGSPPARLEASINEITDRHLSGISSLIDDFVDGKIDLF